MSTKRSFLGTLLDIDSAVTRRIALGMREQGGIVADLFLVLPASLFSQPVTIFACFYPWALMLVEPSFLWLSLCVLPFTLLALVLLALGAKFREGSAPHLAITLIGDGLLIPVGIASSLLLRRGSEVLSVLFISTLFAQRVNQIIKKAFARPRPPIEWPDSFQGRGQWLNVRAWTVHEGRQNKGCLPQDLESFPSGDSAQGGALLSALMILAPPPCKSLLLLAMLAVALGRTYFGCHWLLDSISGLVQGMLCSSVLRLCGLLQGDGRILFNFVGGAICYVLSGIGQRRLLMKKEREKES